MVASPPPDTIESYTSWLKVEHSVTLDARIRNHYDSVASKLQSTVANSLFWKEATAKLKNFHEEYVIASGGYALLTNPDVIPELLRKPYDSFILKTFRKNVQENHAFPTRPSDGWLLPETWYRAVHDIVRTSIVVRYLDGVDFLVGKLTALTAEHGLDCHVDLEAREEGYYAAHLSIGMQAEIPKLDLYTEVIGARFELQITTQLQDVIKRLLHLYYEKHRTYATSTPATKWQWDYKSDEFLTNYLGHILHYVEGMIMEVRARQRIGLTPTGKD